MAEDFVLNARLNLLPPNNVADFKRQLQRSLDGISIDKTLTNEITAIRGSLGALSKDFGAFATKIGSTGAKAAASLKKPKEELDNIAKAVRTGTKELYTFDEQIGVTIRRTAAFAVAAGAIYKTVTALKDGASAAIEYQQQLVRLGQIGNDSRDSIRGLSNDISKLSRSFGVDSVQLIKAASQLRQAGLSLEQVRSSLAGLAKSTLTPSFGELGDTAQGLIAILNQFQNSGKNVEAILSQINEVSKAYAAESSDYIIAVQRTGGAFEQAGGSLEELLALFTTARATTRLSADTIGTAFNTIFNRVQRPEIIQQLQDLGIQLRFSAAEAEKLSKVGIQVNADDFIGPYQAILRISERLRKESTRGPLFGQTLEDVVGLRQIPKAIPLIRDLTKTQEALNLIRRSSTTLDKDSVRAQEALIVQLNKLREGFVDFFRELGNNKLLSNMVSTVLDLAQALTEVSKVLIPLAPYLAILSGLKIASGIGSIANTALKNPVARGTSLIPLKRANKGGYIVPGTGNTDSVPANLESGSFVLRKSASQKLLRRNQGGDVPALLTPGELVFPPDSAKQIGYANLSRMNKFAKGGQVPKRLFKIPIEENKSLFSLIKKSPLLRRSLALNEEFNNTLGAQVLNNTEAPLQTGPIPYITMGVAEMLKKKLGFAKGGEIPDYGTFAQSLGIDFKDVQKYVQTLKLEGNKFISKKTPLSDANYSRLLEFFRPSRTFISGVSPSVADPLGVLPARYRVPQKETIATSTSRAIQPLSAIIPPVTYTPPTKPSPVTPYRLLSSVPPQPEDLSFKGSLSYPPQSYFNTQSLTSKSKFVRPPNSSLLYGPGQRSVIRDVNDLGKDSYRVLSGIPQRQPLSQIHTPLLSDIYSFDDETTFDSRQYYPNRKKSLLSRAKTNLRLFNRNRRLANRPSEEESISLLADLAKRSGISDVASRDEYVRSNYEQLMRTGSVQDASGQYYDTKRGRKGITINPRKPKLLSRLKGLSPYALPAAVGIASELAPEGTTTEAGIKGGLQGFAVGTFTASAVGLGGIPAAVVGLVAGIVSATKATKEFERNLEKIQIEKAATGFNKTLDTAISKGNFNNINTNQLLGAFSEAKNKSYELFGQDPSFAFKLSKGQNPFVPLDPYVTNQLYASDLRTRTEPLVDPAIRFLQVRAQNFQGTEQEFLKQGEIQELFKLLSERSNAEERESLFNIVPQIFKDRAVNSQSNAIVNRQISQFNKLLDVVTEASSKFNILNKSLDSTIPTFTGLQGDSSNLASTISGYNIPKRTSDLLFNTLGAQNNPQLQRFQKDLELTSLAKTAIPEAIKEAGAGLTNQGDFLNLFKDAISKRINDPSFVNRITTLTQQFSSGDKGITGLQENFRDDPTFVNKYLEALSSSATDFTQKFAQQLDGIFNDIDSRLVQNQSLITRINDSNFRGNDLRNSNQEANFGFFSRRIGRSSDAAIGLPYNRQIDPFIRRQETLTGFRGAQALSVNDIRNRLSDVQNQIVANRNILDNSVDPNEILDAKKQRIELVASANRLQEALENLADASSRNAFLQQKINAIEEDRAGRLGFTKSFIAQSAEERQRTLLASQYTGQALRRGSVAGYDAETQQAIISFLESLGNSRLAGFGQITASDALDNLLKDANVRIAGAFGLNNEGNQERLQRVFEDEIRRNNDIAIQAADALTNVFATEQSTFFTQLNDNLAKSNQELARLIAQLLPNNGQAKATGGLITGGIPGRDSVHTRLMPGEFVVNKNATSKNKAILKSLNSGKLAFGSLRNDQEHSKKNLDFVNNKKNNTIYAADGAFVKDPLTVGKNFFDVMSNKFGGSLFGGPLNDRERDLANLRSRNKIIAEGISGLRDSNTNISRGIDDFNLSRNLDYIRLNRKIGGIRQNINQFNEASNVYKNSDSYRRVESLLASTKAYRDRQNINNKVRIASSTVSISPQLSNNQDISGTGPIQLGPEQALLASGRKKEEIAQQKAALRQTYKEELAQTIINKRLRGIGITNRKQRNLIQANPLGVFGNRYDKILEKPSFTPSDTPVERLATKSFINRTLGKTYEDELRQTISKRRTREAQKRASRERTQEAFGVAPHFENRNEAFNFYNGPVQQTPHFKSKREAYFYYNNLRGFAGGGNVPRGTDTVPAMLTPGEFVINAQSTKKYRNLLEKINKDKSNSGGNIQGFQNGGEVKPTSNLNFDSFEKSIQLFNNTSEKFGTSLNSFVSSLSTFGSQTQELINSLSNVKISIERKGTVEVVLNGAQVLANIKGDLEDYVVDRIKQAIGDLKNDIKYNMSTT